MARLLIAKAQHSSSAYTQSTLAPVPPDAPRHARGMHGAALVMAAALSLGLGVCGDGEDAGIMTSPTNNNTPALTSSPAPTPALKPTPSPSPVPTPTPAPTPAPAPATYSVGNTISGLTSGESVTLLDNDDGAVVVNANGSFNFPTKLAQGKPYATTVGTRPSDENCTVTNGSGTMGTNNVTTIAMACTSKPLFGYAVNSNDGIIPAFTLDATTGMSTAVDTAVTVGARPLSLTIDPAGKFVYVANTSANTVTTLSINADTGLLTVVGSATPTGMRPCNIARTPNGRFAYITNYGDSTLSAFSVNTGTGALTMLAPITAGASPYTIATNSAGTFAYVINANSGATPGTTMAFTINNTAGALTQVGTTVNTGNTPQFIVVDLAGTYAYVANAADNTINVYNISNTGALTASDTPIAANTNPYYIAIVLSGSFVYVTNVLAGTVSALSINPSNGAFTLVDTTPTGSALVTVLANPAGIFAYVINAVGNSVNAYSISSTTGKLTAVASRSAATGNIPRGIVIVAIP